MPNEIDDDSFWEEFRQTVKQVNSDAYLVGEIWTADSRWANESHFDGLMNYPVRDDLLRLLYAGTLKTVEFADKVEDLLKLYPKDHVYAMYVPLGSHDTERLWFKLGGNLDKVKLAFMFQFAYPGAPAIYYGDEIGLDGDKDPDCRRAFPWDPANWQGDLQPWVRSLVAARKSRSSLRRGDFIRILADDETNVYAFSRTLGEEKTLVVLNFSDKSQDIQVPVGGLNWHDGMSLRSILDQRPFSVQEGKLAITLSPWSGVWIG